MPMTEHTLSDTVLKLRAEDRDFLADALPRGGFARGLGLTSRSDAAFSAQLAARGWVGMSGPEGYGGAAATAVDRFIVSEEVLRWGAPIMHHWVADRQIAPVLMRFGTEEQKRSFLPRICKGELC